MTNDVHLHIHLPFTSSTVNRRFYYITFSLKTVYYHLILLMGDGVCLLWFTRRAVLFSSQTIPTPLSLRHLLFNLFRHVNQAKSVEHPIDIRHTPDVSQSLGSVHDLSNFSNILICPHDRAPCKALATLPSFIYSYLLSYIPHL